MLLAFAVTLFAVMHLIPAFPSIKARVKDALGTKYGMLFGICSTISVLLIVLGWQTAERDYVYDPPLWGFGANIALSFIAFLCASIFLFRGKLRQVLRLPMSIAVVFWSSGHLLANGDSASVILFGGMLAYGIIHLIAGLSQGFRPSPEVRQGHDVLSIFIGVALYFAMVQLHQFFPGVAIFSIENMAIFAQ